MHKILPLKSALVLLAFTCLSCTSDDLLKDYKVGGTVSGLEKGKLVIQTQPFVIRDQHD